MSLNNLDSNTTADTPIKTPFDLNCYDSFNLNILQRSLMFLFDYQYYI